MRKLNENFTKNEILELAREFKRRRSFLNLSQIKLAKIANLSQSIINKFENGKIDPTYSTILKIEKALSSQENISNIKANDVMIGEIVSINSTYKISKALEIMRKHDFSQLLVMDKEKLIGTIYEKSILDAINQKLDIYSTNVKKIIETSPIIVPKNYSVADLSYIFQNKNTKFILVGENNKIHGIITKSDLFKTS